MYNQHAADQLALMKSPIEHLQVRCIDDTCTCVYLHCITCIYLVQTRFNCEYQLSRKTLGRYGLPGHAHTIKMKDLSGECINNEPKYAKQ